MVLDIIQQSLFNLKLQTVSSILILIQYYCYLKSNRFIFNEIIEDL